jgi:hypothetical protein
MNNKKKKRLYLTLDRNLYNQLVERSKNDFLKVSTWTTRFLHSALSNAKSINDKNPSHDNR